MLFDPIFWSNRIQFRMTTPRDVTMRSVREKYQSELGIEEVRMYYSWNHDGVVLKIHVWDEDTPYSLGMEDNFVLVVQDEIRFLNNYKEDGGLEEDSEWHKAALEKEKAGLDYQVCVLDS
jgi:hypothetical protein